MQHNPGWITCMLNTIVIDPDVMSNINLLQPHSPWQYGVCPTGEVVAKGQIILIVYPFISSQSQIYLAHD